MEEKTVFILRKDLEKLCSDIFLSIGVPAEEADDTA
jgi:hypothetical protein